MRKILPIFSLTIAVLFLFAISFTNNVSAAPPESIKSDMFICPSVSPNNPRGMWVIGGSGAYYVNFPGIASPNWVGLMEGGNALNPFRAVEDNPADVEGQAQVPAGKGLYRGHPSYPYLMGMAMVLPDDGEEFISDTFGLVVPGGIMIKVMPSDTPMWDPTPIPGTMLMGTLYANVPLESAAFW